MALRVFWINDFGDGCFSVSTREADAKRRAVANRYFLRTIKVREVPGRRQSQIANRKSQIPQ